MNDPRSSSEFALPPLVQAIGLPQTDTGLRGIHPRTLPQESSCDLHVVYGRPSCSPPLWQPGAKAPTSARRIVCQQPTGGEGASKGATTDRLGDRYRNAGSSTIHRKITLGNGPDGGVMFGRRGINPTILAALKSKSGGETISGNEFRATTGTIRAGKSGADRSLRAMARDCASSAPARNHPPR